MAKVIWKGEDDLHFALDEKGEKIPAAGPSFTMWNGVKFEKGKPVEVTNETALKKARGNPFFDVVDEERRGPGRPPKPKDDLNVAHENP